MSRLMGLGLVLAIAGWMVAAPEKDEKSMLEAARSALKLRNYNEAIAQASALIAGSKDDDLKDDASQIVGLSQLGLGQTADAYQTLHALVERRPERAREPIVAEGLAVSSLSAGLKGEEVINYFLAAAKLYEAEGNRTKQIELLGRLAEFCTNNPGQFGDDSETWDIRRLSGVARALEAYDLALAAGGTIDEQIRMLRGKADALQSAGWNLQNIPKDRWPANLNTKYDLTRPFDLAIDTYREIVQRFPDRPSAAEALLEIGGIQQNAQQNYVVAVATYDQIIAQYTRFKPIYQEATNRRREIIAPQLSVSIEDIAEPGQKVRYRWSARNLAKIDFSAYPIDLFAGLRKVGLVDQLASLPPTGKPVATWSVETGDAGKHEPTSSGDDPVLAPISESRAYLIVAIGSSPEGKKAEARAIALVSGIGMIAKTGLSKAQFFAVDSRTGQPKPNTQLLVQRYLRDETVPILNTTRRVYEYLDLVVPDSGLAELSFDPKPSQDRWNHQVVAIARDGENYAIVGGNYWGGWWGVANGRYAYCYTDRPVYRPNQTVNFKAVLRESEEGTYRLLAGKTFHVAIRDGKGETVYEKDHVANEAGSISGQLTLAKEPALGVYSISIDEVLSAKTLPNQPGLGRVQSPSRGMNVGPGASFRVEEYKKPEFEVTISTEKPLFKIGDKLPLVIHGEYYFGGGVPKAKVTYTVHRESRETWIPWVRPYAWFYDESPRFGRWWGGPRREDLVAQGDLTTDDKGNASLEIVTEPFPNAPTEDVKYRVDVTMVDESRREIRASQTFVVTRQAFALSLDPVKHIYQPGDTVRVRVKSQNANGAPVSFEGRKIISWVAQREERDETGKVTTEEKLETIVQQPISAGEKGEAEVEFVADKEGYYKIVVEAPDPFAPDGLPVTGTAYLWVAQAGGAFAHYAHRDIEVVLERETYQVGESIRFLVNCRHPGTYVWLSAEGDEIYQSKVVFVEGTQAVVEWPVTQSLIPMVAIKGTYFRDQKIHEDERSVYVPPVEQFLTVKIVAPKEEFRPREEAEIAVEVTDSEGQPVAGTELSLGAFDASILYIQPETRGDIRKFFHGRQRPVTVQTSSSFHFQSQRRVPMNARDGVGFGAGGFAGRQMDMMAKAGAPAPEAAPALAAEAGEEAAMAPVEVRTDFRDTVYWAAHLTTDSSGKALAKIKFPDTLSRWRLTAIVADPTTRVGEMIHEVRTKKNVLVRLQTPRFVVEGDVVVLSAIVRNDLPEAKEVRVDLTETEGLSLLAVNTSAWELGAKPTPMDAKDAVAQVEIPSGGEKRVDFVYRAGKVGTVSATAKALTDVESDAMKLEFPCYEYGAEKLLAQSGVIYGSASDRTASARLEIPAEIRSDSQSLVVRVSPTVAGVMLESLPYLLDYPYGCTEQTMSRFLPAVLTSRTLQSLGMNLADVAKIESDNPQVRKRLERFRHSPVTDDRVMNRIIRAGVRRLVEFQRPDGGWSWWKEGDANPYISAYVVMGLSLARGADVQIPAGVLERGVDYLALVGSRPEPLRDHPWQPEENVSLRAYVLHSLGTAAPARLKDPEITKRLRELFEKRDGLTDQARAFLAMALADAGLGEEADIVASNIVDRAQRDAEIGAAHWGAAGSYWYWYDGGTESTSHSLRSLLRLKPDSPLIPEAVRWLVRHREGTRWFNTKDTAIACHALSEYLRATGELDPDLTIIVDVDGAEARRVRVTKDNLFTFDHEVRIAGADLGTGRKEITVRAEGRGNVYWGTYANFFTKEPKIEAAASEIAITREYVRLIPKQVTKTRTVFDPRERKQVEEKYQAIDYDRKPISDGDMLTSGDLIEVKLTINAKNNFEYLLFEDPKPAGCEAVELTSGYQWANGLAAYTERRDERIAFFSSYLNQGKHEITYQLRAEIPGEFHALPARAECMYTPYVRGNGASNIVRVADGPAQP